MNPELLTFLALGCGAGFGGVLLLVAATGGQRRVPVPPALQFASWSRAKKVRLLSAVVAAVLVLLITRWVVLAAAALLAVIFWPTLFGGARSQVKQIRRLEALAGWVESLRDTISTGLALPEALPMSARTAPEEIKEPLELLVERMRSRQSLDAILLQFADDLDDPIADSVVGALTMNARVQGKRLNIVLTSLAESVRKQLTVRREIEAERSGTRRGVSIVMFVTAAFLVGTTVFNPSYVEPYGTVTGQLVLAIILTLFAAGFAWLRKLADFETPQRFLATPAVIARNQQLTAARSLSLPSVDPAADNAESRLPAVATAAGKVRDASLTPRSTR